MRATRSLRQHVLGAVLAGVVALLASDGSVAARGRVADGAPLQSLGACAPGVELLGFSDVLNKTTVAGTNVGGLSALAYDRQHQVFYSLVDNEADTAARLYTLRIPISRRGLDTPQVVNTTTLRDATGQPFNGGNFDGEGLVLTRRDELLIASENEPTIRRFRRDGTFVDALPVPARFQVAPAGEATANRTFESLTLSPNQRNLFTAVEEPLAPDGATDAGRNRIRILRYAAQQQDALVPAAQYFYLTESGQAVVELVALSARSLLVLERGFVPDQGNTVRVFHIDVADAANVADVPSLASTTVQPVAKTLLVDLADCPPSDATTPGTQRNPLLDNFESLALGPRLLGGRQTLVLQSDDNFNPTQVTRVIVLAVRFQHTNASSTNGDVAVPQ